MQLIGMSHCTPEATLKPKRFEFTLKTVISGIQTGNDTRWRSAISGSPLPVHMLYGDLSETSHRISETVQDRTKVTVND